MGHLKKINLLFVFTIFIILAVLCTTCFSGCNKAVKSGKKQIDPEEILNKVDYKTEDSIAFHLIQQERLRYI